MGLVLIRARFKQGAPDVETLEAEVARQLGSTSALDSVDVHDGVVNVLLEPDAVAQAYVASAIAELGGECVDAAGNPARLSLPAHVSRPWLQWPRWRRGLFRLGIR